MSGYFLFFSHRQGDYSKLLLSARHRAILEEWTEMPSKERLQWIKDAKLQSSQHMIADLNLKEEKKQKLDITSNPYYATLLADKAETKGAKYRTVPRIRREKGVKRRKKIGERHEGEQGRKEVGGPDPEGSEDDGNSSSGVLSDSTEDEEKDKDDDDHNGKRRKK